MIRSLSLKNSNIGDGSTWSSKFFQTPFETTRKFLVICESTLHMMSFPKERKAAEHRVYPWPKHKNSKRPQLAVAFLASDKIVKCKSTAPIFSQYTDLSTFFPISKYYIDIIYNKKVILQLKPLFIQSHLFKSPFKTVCLNRDVTCDDVPTFLRDIFKTKHERSGRFFGGKRARGNRHDVLLTYLLYSKPLQMKIQAV